MVSHTLPYVNEGGMEGKRRMGDNVCLDDRDEGGRGGTGGGGGRLHIQLIAPQNNKTSSSPSHNKNRTLFCSSRIENHTMNRLQLTR